jgi:hypothetical protein
MERAITYTQNGFCDCVEAPESDPSLRSCFNNNDTHRRFGRSNVYAEIFVRYFGRDLRV